MQTQNDVRPALPPSSAQSSPGVADVQPQIEIWRIHESGERVLVRDDIRDLKHANSLAEMGNHGAMLNGENYSYLVLQHGVESSELAAEPASQDDSTKEGVSARRGPA
ncbi:hypothetical protein BLA39750_01086 [Burkholderia lata]|uniref:Uncharacterized protein n=1 Tax=Burkholderia lata (strain ATCC 17760 / DSM 23089 / LMG 22485 / NCIMB 9086 / R18194 / 383) TaxID=482957 RepID=A0A6P2VKS2_BURL3|nr:hypothetical protein [Burkholderia lata]VWC79436.1 hypothetical protein BLA39750_01086 [Burkholderia lata]